MSYQKIATEAAEYEKNGNLKLAALMWAKAADIAKKDLNRRYAEHRELYCIRYQFKKD